MADAGHHGSTGPRGPWNVGLLGPRDSLRQRSIPSVWLAFLFLPLFGTWARSETATHDVVVTVLTVAFAGLFFYASASADVTRARWSRDHHVAVAVGLFAVPTFLCFFDDAGWAYIFVYGLLPLMRLFPQTLRYRAVLAVVAGTAAVAVAAGGNSGDILAPVCVVAGSGFGWLGFGRLLEANTALERAQMEKAQVAVAEERLRFARDLHDLLGHSLSVITLKSEVAGRLLAVDAERAGAEVAEIEQVARRALKEVREAVSGYRQATVAVELAGARTALASAHITWTESTHDDLALPEAVEGVLAWALREGVTNVIRHSQAAACALDVHLDGDGDRAVVTVTDDGIGGVGAPCGNGLRGLAERVQAVGGTLTTGPTTTGPTGAAGYSLRVEVPVGAQEMDVRRPAPASPRESSVEEASGPWGRMLAAARVRTAE